MKHHRITLVLVLILTALLGGTALLLPASAPAQQSRAYIEPGLQLIDGRCLSARGRSGRRAGWPGQH
jgi:hypothetical protein